jgi:hypothetical protein
LFLKSRFPIKMLSKLAKAKLKLFGLIRNRWYFKRFIEPGPEIPMGKQVHSQQSNQVRKGPVEFGSKLEEAKDQHRDQCCPNLDLHGIGTGPNKGLDLQVLLQILEEDLDLPTVFINGGNSRRTQIHMVG